MVEDPQIARRDAGLDRVSRLTRWTIGGGVVLTGVFSVVAAQAYAGKSTSAVPASNPSAGQPVQGEEGPLNGNDALAGGDDVGQQDEPTAQVPATTVPATVAPTKGQAVRPATTVPSTQAPAARPSRVGRQRPPAQNPPPVSRSGGS